jgi:hypothetical protein
MAQTGLHRPGLQSNHQNHSHFPEGVIHRKSYLNDVRFDLKRGTEGWRLSPTRRPKVPMESSSSIWHRAAAGDGCTSIRSVMADPTFTANLEGEPLMQRKPGQPPKPLSVGSDGIAISADGERLFYCALPAASFSSVKCRRPGRSQSFGRKGCRHRHHRRPQICL